MKKRKNKSSRTLETPIDKSRKSIEFVARTLIALCALITILITAAIAFALIGDLFGISIVAESALGVGIVMGIMIIPYISSLSDDVLASVPRHLQEGSLALGATKSEGIKKVLVPAAIPGILAAVLLAFSRAI